jgi:hypothetical protein
MFNMRTFFHAKIIQNLNIFQAKMNKFRQHAIHRLICLAPAIYFIGFCLFAVHQFSDYGSDWPQLLRYVLVPFLLAAGLIYVAFWARHHIALQVGINVCAVLVALFAFEAVQTSRVLRSFANTVQASLSDIAREQGLRDALPPTATVKRLNGRKAELSRMGYSTA